MEGQGSSGHLRCYDDEMLSLGSAIARRSLATSGAVQSDRDGKMRSHPNKALDLANAEVVHLARQLGIDLTLLFHEIYWALGEERINRVTPTYDRFREWARQRDGLSQFWEFANTTLSVALSPDEVEDIWQC